MRDAARAQAAIETLARIEADLERRTPTADKRLTEWARGARYAGSKDRRAVADLVYRALRRRGSYLSATGAVDAPAAARARMLIAAALIDAGGDGVAAAERTFSGERHAPAPLTARETERVAAAVDRLAASETALADFPAAFREDLAQSVADPAAEIRRLRERAAPDLRVNLLKTDRAALLKRLSEDGVAAAPGPLAPTAVRLAAPTPMARLAVFEAGWVEVQDAASQATALLAEAAAGERALDYCAGGGGKTLALAAATGGPVWAFDIEPRRMADLPGRAARAGAEARVLGLSDLAALTGAFDLVFVDAPCSGSGAWARNPDAKWSARPAIRPALRAAQQSALRNAARHVRPGGRLVYVTCSIFAWENQDQVAAFLEAAPAFDCVDLGVAWARAGLDAAPPAGPSSGRGWTLIPPSAFETDGFFVALFKRSGGAADL